MYHISSLISVKYNMFEFIIWIHDISKMLNLLWLHFRSCFAVCVNVETSLSRVVLITMQSIDLGVHLLSEREYCWCGATQPKEVDILWLRPLPIYLSKITHQNYCS